MNKKILLIARILHAAVLVFLLVLSLFSCSDDDNENEKDPDPFTEIIGEAVENTAVTFSAGSSDGLPDVAFIEKDQTLYGLGQNIAAVAPQKIEVWSTKNGADWMLEATTIGTKKRHNYAAVTFNSKLWVIGGKEGNTDRKNDVWSSENGKDWKKEIENAAFSPRDLHNAVVLRDSIYIVGGSVSDGTSSKAANDIWRSKDGITWYIVSNNFTFNYSKVVVLDNAMYAFQKSGAVGSIYRSTDGKAWSKFASFDVPSGFLNERMISANGALWIAGISVSEFLVWKIDAAGKTTALADKFKSVSDLFKSDKDFVFIDDGFYGATIFQNKFLIMMRFGGANRIFTADVK